MASGLLRSTSKCNGVALETARKALGLSVERLSRLAGRLAVEAGAGVAARSATQHSFQTTPSTEHGGVTAFARPRSTSFKQPLTGSGDVKDCPDIPPAS